MSRARAKQRKMAARFGTSLRARLRKRWAAIKRSFAAAVQPLVDAFKRMQQVLSKANRPHADDYVLAGPSAGEGQ